MLALLLATAVARPLQSFFNRLVLVVSLRRVFGLALASGGNLAVSACLEVGTAQKAAFTSRCGLANGSGVALADGDCSRGAEKAEDRFAELHELKFEQ